MSNFKIEPFFPNTNLNSNPQGWITDFITSRLHRVGNDRSDLANLIYDDKKRPVWLTYTADSWIIAVLILVFEFAKAFAPIS